MRVPQVVLFQKISKKTSKKCHFFKDIKKQKSFREACSVVFIDTYNESTTSGTLSKIHQKSANFQKKNEMVFP